MYAKKCHRMGVKKCGSHSADWCQCEDRPGTKEKSYCCYSGPENALARRALHVFGSILCTWRRRKDFMFHEEIAQCRNYYYFYYFFFAVNGKATKKNFFFFFCKIDCDWKKKWGIWFFFLAFIKVKNVYIKKIISLLWRLKNQPLNFSSVSGLSAFFNAATLQLYRLLLSRNIHLVAGILAEL